MVQAGFIVVNKYGGRNMHGVDQDQAFHNPALSQAFHHLRRDIDKSPPGRDLKPQLFSIAFHQNISLSLLSAK